MSAYYTGLNLKKKHITYFCQGQLVVEGVNVCKILQFWLWILCKHTLQRCGVRPCWTFLLLRELCTLFLNNAMIKYAILRYNYLFIHESDVNISAQREAACLCLDLFIDAYSTAYFRQ
jgi:hypothetical protein